MSLPRSIAFRFLKASKWQTFFIVLGISVGVAIQIFIGVLITSLQKNIIDNVIGNSSQITILSDTGQYQILGYEEMIEKLEEFDELTAISVAQDSSALTNFSAKTTSIYVRGFNFDDADKIYEIEEKITEGDRPENDNEVIIGKDLSDDLNLDIDDTFFIQVAAKKINEEVIVKGIFDFKVKSINKLWVLTTLKTAQNIFINGTDSVSSIEMQVSEDYYFEADEIAKDIEDELDNGDIEVKNWMEENEDLQGGLQAQSTSSYFIQTFAIISVIIGVASVLSISVLQKSKQLGILKAMGIKNRDASKIFLYQGLFFGIGGSIGGILLGMLLLFGFSFSSTALTITIDPIFLLISAIIVTSAAVLASLFPAIKSSKLDPIDVIRGE